MKNNETTSAKAVATAQVWELCSVKGGKKLFRGTYNAARRAARLRQDKEQSLLGVTVCRHNEDPETYRGAVFTAN